MQDDWDQQWMHNYNTREDDQILNTGCMSEMRGQIISINYNKRRKLLLGILTLNFKNFMPGKQISNGRNK